MRGFSVGEESAVRVCFVVIWKKMGVFRRVVSESSRRGSFFSLEGVSFGFLICLMSAFRAFCSCY